MRQTRIVPADFCCVILGATILALGVGLLGCGGPAPPTETSDELPESLTQLQLYQGNLAELIPSNNVFPYAMNSSSFVDYAHSEFVVRPPTGKAAEYRPDGVLEFPVGTILAQTLTYPDGGGEGKPRHVETRVLLRREDKWIALPYLWNPEQTDARLELVGARVPILRRASDGTLREQSHVVPNFNDCKRCHRIGPGVTPIGVTARQLNRPAPGDATGPSQLTTWSQKGLITGAPPAEQIPSLPRWNDPATGNLAERARAWLDINCAHCHNLQGTARNSGLFLSSTVGEATTLGVLKSPVAAGRGSVGLQFDILPGQPRASILLRRIQSTEPGVMMPEFGRTQVDEEGVALLQEWIESMPAVDLATFAPGAVGFVNDLTPADLATWSAEAMAQGDAARGEAVFARPELNCTKCHAIRGRGPSVGPDLATLKQRGTPEHIVESILLPAKEVRNEYRMVTVQTASGLVVIGVVVVEDPGEIILRDPVRGDTSVSKNDIVDRIEGGTLMPSNVVSMLRREEFLDLVRYLVELNRQPTEGTNTQSP